MGEVEYIGKLSPEEAEKIAKRDEERRKQIINEMTAKADPKLEALMNKAGKSLVINEKEAKEKQVEESILKAKAKAEREYQEKTRTTPEENAMREMLKNLI